MHKITIADKDGKLYEIEAFDQNPKVTGATPHTVLINGEQVGHVRHDPEDGPWALARLVFATFPPGEPLDGAQATFRRWMDNPGELRKALLEPGSAPADQVPFVERLRQALADESPSSQLNRAAVERLRARSPQAGDPQ